MDRYAVFVSGIYGYVVVVILIFNYKFLVKVPPSYYICVFDLI